MKPIISRLVSVVPRWSQNADENASRTSRNLRALGRGCRGLGQSHHGPEQPKRASAGEATRIGWEAASRSGAAATACSPTPANSRLPESGFLFSSVFIEGWSDAPLKAPAYWLFEAWLSVRLGVAQQNVLAPGCVLSGWSGFLSWWVSLQLTGCFIEEEDKDSLTNGAFVKVIPFACG